MPICLFDIDGTLLNTGGAGKAAFESTLELEFGIRDLEGGVLYAGRTDRAIVEELFRVHAIEESRENWHRFLRIYPERLSAILPDYSGGVLPGIHRLIGHLEGQSDVALGLLTGNLRRGAELKLGHYGLGEAFPFGGFGDDHTDRRDVARAAVDSASRHLGPDWPSDGAIVVGDTPHDIRCGRAIGAHVVAVATGGPSVDELAAHDPDLLLPDLSDPTPLLRLIESCR